MDVVGRHINKVMRMKLCRNGHHEGKTMKLYLCTREDIPDWGECIGTVIAANNLNKE